MPARVLLPTSSASAPGHRRPRTCVLVWLAAALALILAAPIAAQAGGARVSGRVLDAGNGAPVAQALVRLTADDTRASALDTTNADGRFMLPVPSGRGPYSLRAERIGYRALTTGVSADEVAAGFAWRDVRLNQQAIVLAPVVARPGWGERNQTPPRAPGGSDQTTHSWSRGTVPVDGGDLGAMAQLQGGVHPADGGVSFLAQDPSQGRVTLDGAPFGSSAVPQEALAAVTVTQSTYDVSRGQFSSGLIAATTLGGSNLFGAALRSRLTSPRLQWRAGPAAAGSPPSTFGHAEGAAGGAIVPDCLFWYAAIAGSRRSAPAVSLESASPALLAAHGVDPDSAAAAAAYLRGAGVHGAERTAGDTRATQGTALLRLDYDVSDRHSLMLRLDGRRLELDRLGPGALSTLASGGAARETGGGVLARLTSRIGAVDSEFQVYAGEESRRLAPEHPGPSGTVRVASLSGGEDGGSVLRFGGSPASSETDGARLEISEKATMAVGGAHEVAAGFVAGEERARVSAAGNRYGTFSFHSLADLRAGRPALFTRTAGERAGEASARHAALYLGDTWRRGPLRLTFGARAEARWYPAAGGDAPEAFGARAGRIPSEWGVSPRLGWSYQRGAWYLLGGVGEFRGTVPATALAAAAAEGGAVARLTCVGDAAPAPEWDRYAADPLSVPDRCADGAPAFASASRDLTLFAPDFAAPRSWRASLGGHFPLPGPFRLDFDASLTRGAGRPVARDRNLDAAPELALSAEGGRPVYAPLSAIDPATGGIAPDGSRLLPEWGIVREVSGRGRATVAQATAELGFPFPLVDRFSLSASYTHTRAWDHAGSLAVAGGAAPVAADLLRPVWGTADLERRHDLRLRLTWRARWWATVGVLGRLTSGAPFTPMVDGDVNGDGAANDPAFVLDPAAVEDTALAGGMSRLLDGAPEHVRACLARQAGSLARRNGCRGAWTQALDLRADLMVGPGGADRRLRLSVVTGNALGLLDRVLHGRGGVRGWGEASLPDPTLLRVRGFDPAARAFRYDVNPGFGRPAGSAGRLRAPFSLTLEGRLAVGADPAFQPLRRMIAANAGVGRTAEEIRAELARRVPNPPAQVVALDSALRLGLTPAEREHLLREAEAAGARLAPLADSVAATLSSLENGRHPRARAGWREVWTVEREIRTVLEASLAGIRALLGPERWATLPEAVRVPPRQLVPLRTGGPAGVR